MTRAQKELPNDIAACHALIISMHKKLARQDQSFSEKLSQQCEEPSRINHAQLRVMQEQINTLKAELARVFEQMHLARLRFFGRSSEKSSPDQLPLVFNEAEASILPVESLSDEVETPVTPPRKRKPRRTLAQSVPEGTPVIDIVHDLPEAQRQCPHDGHALHVIGEDDGFTGGSPCDQALKSEGDNR